MSTALLAGGAGLSILLIHRSPTGGRAVASSRPEPAIALIASGHVDMEHGVVSLYSKLPGQIVDVLVAENDSVKAGTILVQLDDHATRLRLQRAESDLAAATQKLAEADRLPAQHAARIEVLEGGVAAAQSKVEAARLLLQRQRDLVKMKLVDRMQAETAEATLHEAEALLQTEEARLRELRLANPEAEIAMARAAHEASQIQVELARQAVADCQIKAPIDGSILRVLVGAGDMLGVSAPQPAILFCPAGKRIVRAEVEQEFASRVAVGQSALIQDDALGGGTWHGKVARVSDWFTQRRSVIQEPLQLNDVRTLECIVALDEGQPPLRIGQRVRVKIADNRIDPLEN
ncbi:MAG: HlyD family secretion protein [Gemmataceae bacterium]